MPKTARKARRRTVDLTVRIPPALKDDLDLLAIAADTSRNKLATQALTEYVQRAIGKGQQ